MKERKQKAAKQDKHVCLLSPQGKEVSVPRAEVARFIAKGYTVKADAPAKPVAKA